MPLNGVFFRDDKHGWAVGELGTILATGDGGQNWTVQHRGGERAAVLMIHARATGTPVDTAAWLGLRNGYLTACLRVTGPEPATVAPGRVGDAAAYAAVLRQAGGTAGEMLWQFPLPAHIVRGQQDELIKTWDKLHDDHAAEQMLRQLILAMRHVAAQRRHHRRSGKFAQDYPAEALVAEAVREALHRAGDPAAFVEQQKHSACSRGNRPSFMAWRLPGGWRASRSI